MLDTFLYMFGQLWPIAILMTMVVCLCAYVFIKAPANYWFKFTLIPAALFLWVFALYLMSTSLGYSISMKLPEQFIYIAHNVTMVNNKKETIEIWMEKKPTRLIKVPYSSSLEKALEGAKTLAQHGGKVVVTTSNAGKSTHGDPNQQEENGYHSRLILPEEVNPKSPE